MKWYFATRSPEAVFRPLVLAGVAVLVVVVVVVVDAGMKEQ